MTALRRVVVATDFSEGARRASRRAALLPLAPGAELLLVHAWRRPDGRGRAEAAERAVRERLEEEASALSAGLRARGADRATVGVELVAGRPVDGILSVVARVGPDLLVAGKRGAGGLRGLLLGSTAERTTWRATAPVLLVGGPVSAGYARPLLAVDARDDGRVLAGAALRVASPVSDLALVHAYRVQFEGWVTAADRTDATVAALRDQARAEGAALLADLAGAIAPAGVRVTRVLRKGDARPVVLQAARRWAADLLVVGSHRRGGTAAHALVGSVALAVLRSAPCDVLAVPL